MKQAGVVGVRGIDKGGINGLIPPQIAATSFFIMLYNFITKP